MLYHSTQPSTQAFHIPLLKGRGVWVVPSTLNTQPAVLWSSYIVHPPHQLARAGRLPPHPTLSQLYGLPGLANLLPPTPTPPTAQHSRDQGSKTPSPHAHPCVGPYPSAAATAQPTLLVKGCTGTISTGFPTASPDSSVPRLHSF